MKNQKSKILLVDDENNILKSLKRMLRNEPYEIKTANTPEEAIKTIETEKFDLIISDYRMPGMNGTEMFYKINRKSPDSVNIILSGYADINTVTDALNQEYVDKYILKPWNEENLKLEIQKSIEHCKLIQTNKELHEKVLKQNKELKKINETLESLVLKRTLRLELQNKALRTSQTVLNNIPVPVIGIDHEKMIVLTNKIAHKKLPRLIPGDRVKIDNLREHIEEISDSQTEKILFMPEILPEFPLVYIAPLEKNDKGCLVTFLPGDQKG